MPQVARLRWRCRRGMRELDLVLTRFLDDCVGGLTEHQIRVFERLLERGDQEILAWIYGRETPTEALESIINMIREHQSGD